MGGGGRRERSCGGGGGGGGGGEVASINYDCAMRRDMSVNERQDAIIAPKLLALQ